MSEEYIKFGFSFKPPLEVSDRAIFISKQLGAKHQSKFILDGKNFYPHITIYPPHYPAKNLSKIIKNIEGVVKNTGSIKMTFTEVGSKNGYIAVYFELTPVIKELHKNIVKVLNPLREGYINPRYREPEKIANLTKQELENIKNYGYPYMMDQYYHPHLTLIRLEDVLEAQRAVEDIKWDIKEFEVDKLFLHKIGANGGANEIIKEFELK